MALGSCCDVLMRDQMDFLVGTPIVETEPSNRSSRLISLRDSNIEKPAEPLTSPKSAEMFFYRLCAFNQLVLKCDRVSSDSDQIVPSDR